MGSVVTERTCEKMWVARIVIWNNKTESDDSEN